MSDNDASKPKSEPANPNSTEPQVEPTEGSFDPQPVEDVQPGTSLQNPAQPYARTIVPDATTAESFLRDAPGVFTGYPKMKFHPVHGGVEVKDPSEEAQLGRDWFGSAELADAARTATEAMVAQAQNMRAKVQELDERGHPIVRNSVQADQAIRDGKPEPL